MERLVINSEAAARVLGRLEGQGRFVAADVWEQACLIGCMSFGEDSVSRDIRRALPGTGKAQAVRFV